MTIAATIEAEQASRRTWDVAVVGAGPAGALAARELAQRGCAVLSDRSRFVSALEGVRLLFERSCIGRPAHGGIGTDDCSQRRGAVARYSSGGRGERR